jgi:hypothetical protein
MGGKSSSSSATHNYQRQISLNAADNEGIAVGAGGDVVVNALDGGAIDAAFDFASEGLEGLLDWTSDQARLAFGATDKALDQTKTAYESFIEKDRSDNAQALDKMTKYFFLTVGLFGVVWGLNKFR